MADRLAGENAAVRFRRGRVHAERTVRALGTRRAAGAAVAGALGGAAAVGLGAGRGGHRRTDHRGRRAVAGADPGGVPAPAAVPDRAAAGARRVAQPVVPDGGGRGARDAGRHLPGAGGSGRCLAAGQGTADADYFLLYNWGLQHLPCAVDECMGCLSSLFVDMKN